MTKIKSPGLLIRISHLILIQIFFVFTAIALLLFYPQGTPVPAERLADIEQKSAAFSSQIGTFLAESSLKKMPDSMMTARIRNLAVKNELILSLGILAIDSAVNTRLLFSYDRFKESDSGEIDSRYGQIHSFLKYLKRMDKKSANLWMPGDNFISHITLRSSKDMDYAIIAKTYGVQPVPPGNTQGYLLLLLFLISTLISLLIINLISRGIKKPLDQLLAGFDETALGKMHHIPEDQGDEDIRKITCAFNKMSLNLSQQQKKLKEANENLVQANKSLVESESILTALVDFSPDAIIVTDLEDQVIIYNQAAARDFGYGQSNMMGKKISNLLPLSKLKSESSLTAQDDWEAQEIICRRRDGSRFPAMLVHTPLGPEREKPMALLYFIRNISESDKYQNMILKLDRIASRGKMARDIAHEINNYLAILQGNLELLPIILAGDDPEKAEEKLNLMKQTVNNISTFTEGLSRFSDEDSEFVKEDLNQLVENLIAFIKPQNKFDNIFIGTNLSENLPMVSIDAAQIQHLIINLLANSADALASVKGKKWIVISTSVDESMENFYIKIADSGPGISDEYLDRIFVSRFSTHRESTGLGLITCKNIVDNHHGEISYHSSEESKAIFIIKIPIVHSEEHDETTQITVRSKSPVPSPK